MHKPILPLLAALVLIGLAARSEAANGWRLKPGRPVATHADVTAARHAQTLSWHGPYAHTGFGTPVALVVPPTAHMETNWGWGVSQGSMTPIYPAVQPPLPRRYGGRCDWLRLCPHTVLAQPHQPVRRVLRAKPVLESIRCRVHWTTIR